MIEGSYSSRFAHSRRWVQKAGVEPITLIDEAKNISPQQGNQGSIARFNQLIIFGSSEREFWREGNSVEFHYGQAKVIAETELERIHRIDVDDKLDLFGRLDIGDRSMN